MYLILSSVGIPAKTDGIIKQVIIKAQVEYFKRVFTTIFHVTPTHFVTATRQRFFFCLHRCFIQLNLLVNPRPYVTSLLHYTTLVTCCQSEFAPLLCVFVRLLKNVKVESFIRVTS